MVESKVKCPTCGSNLVTEISNARHCQQCGADFDLDRFPITSAARRRKSQGFVGGWKREPQK
jgi:DNA-directed RNA polymerase subunit M/transcription elongation factor TFIIS